MNWDVRNLQDSLHWIPLLPLVGAAVLRLAGRFLGRESSALLACATVFASFVLSALILLPMAVPGLLTTPAPMSLAHDYGVWFSAGSITARASVYVDHLNALLLVVVTGVGFIIHVYATEYMAKDPDHHRFFAYLNLFVAFMLVLVLANDLLLMFVGWEGVGLCSYLLIGFWYEDDANASAGRKAFVVNRIGDLGFLVGIFVLLSLFGTAQLNAVGESEGLLAALKSVTLTERVPSGVLATLELTWLQALTVAALALFVGATGKSAQVPLYVWLPDAMAGPTPVSALIHAATMVTAGVYMIARLAMLYASTPDAMAVVAAVGAFTALFAALMGFAQNDIKKVLAYSTVSQLGFMIIGVGIGAWWQAIFHLVTHAFFKALLFLGAGSVILGCHHEQDITRMGGLRRRMGSTWFTFLVGTVAITGVLPLSGFFSKDELLHFAHHATVQGYAWLPGAVYWAGTVAAFCTAFYMFRLYFLVFEGEARSEKAAHAEETGRPVRFALWTLALLSIVAAAWGLPLLKLRQGFQVVFENFTLPVFAEPLFKLGVKPGQVFEAAGVGGALAAFVRELGSGLVVALGVAWAGLGLAWVLYRKGGIRALGFLQPGNVLYDLFAHKFYVDEIYAFALVRPFRALSVLLWEVVDVLLIDTLVVRGTAFVTGTAGELLRRLQNGDAQRYAAVVAIAVVAIVWALTTV